MQPNQKFTNQQFLELYNKGKNDRQIAEILNVNNGTIARRRYRLNLMPKNPQSNSNPTLNHERLKKSAKKQTPKRKAQIKAYNKSFKQSRKKYSQTTKGKIAKRKTNQKQYQKKIKGNPNYNKEQYKKRKIKKQQPF